MKRYVSLTNLLPELLEKVDSGKIGFVPAVNLSGIEKDAQKWILKVLDETNKRITLRQSDFLKKEAAAGTLTEETVVTILVGKSAIVRTVTISEVELKKFFPDQMDSGEIKKVILELIKQWKEETENG